jgi:hypothetical protein
VSSQAATEVRDAGIRTEGDRGRPPSRVVPTASVFAGRAMTRAWVCARRLTPPAARRRLATRTVHWRMRSQPFATTLLSLGS